MVELAASMVGDDDPRQAMLDCERRILRAEDPLDQDRETGLRAQPVDVVPRGWGERTHTRMELVSRRRFGHRLTAQRRGAAGRERVPHISPPQPEHGSVDRHAERPIAGRLRGGDKLPCCRAIASKVKLVPQARTSSAGHLADCPM